MNPTEEIKMLKEQISGLSKDLAALNDEFYRNNFSGRQDFVKYCSFNNRLKVPHYASTPSTGEVGEVIEVAGVLYVCSAANVWTKVGLQV